MEYRIPPITKQHEEREIESDKECERGRVRAAWHRGFDPRFLFVPETLPKLIFEFISGVVKPEDSQIGLTNQNKQK